MGNKLKNLALIGLGLVAGVAATTQFSALAQRNTPGPLPLEELRQLADVFGLIKNEYVDPVPDEKLLTEAISGMVASLDPHSAYLDKQAFLELREGTEGKFVGIGIEVGMEDGYVKIISPIEDTPAFRAGLHAGDLITRLDSVPVKGMTLENAIKKMRGEPHTKITLTISRKGEEKPVVVTVVREIIKSQSVKAKMIEPGYAWLRISQFQEPTVEDLAKKLQNLYQQDAKIKGLVLDLRNDPGGVLPGAIGVAAAFLPKDVVVVTTNGQLPDSKASYEAKRENYSPHGNDPLAKLPAGLKSVPMVVLINTGSASASEIVAGALQDYHRATVLGTPSFGKGSVQTIRQISADTAIKLTTARYYTPNGRSIQAKGIAPDLLVEETENGDGFNGLRTREADLDKHLRNDKDGEPSPANKVDELEEEQRLFALAKRAKPLEYGSANDFQLAQALNHLKGLPVKVVHGHEVAAQDDAASKPADAAKNGR